MKPKTDQWQGCYPSNWKGLIAPESMAHPAKYSSRLIRRIYEHMISEGWLKAGDRVIDIFGGVALGALDAMRLGLDWTGVELEVKFVDLGTVNIVNWNNRFGNMPNWGSARLLQGDSRKLLEIVQGAEAAISSPPYAGSMERSGGIDPTKSNHKGGPHSQMNNSDTRYGTSLGQLGAMPANGFDAAISSPPFLQSEGGTPEPKPGGTIDNRLYARHAAGNAKANGYGTSEGQLSSMRDGGFEGAVSSPPFGKTVLHDGGPALQQGGELHSDYGDSEGQLSAMPASNFDAAISSPPYEDSDQNYKAGWERFHRTKVQTKFDSQLEAEYGDSEGQLSAADDFWLAARLIVSQVYQALSPGGHAVWVTKRYVKGGKIVEFSEQWAQLCEAVGFRVVCWHHAMLVHNKGKQHTLDGGVHEYRSESKSFFRRLAEKKGSPRIDWEDVICMVKPT